jgi:predicted transcriptional regulator
VQCLQRLGINRNVARVITHLKSVNKEPSREIEMATDLRQPEISIAMRTLRENGWLAESEIKSIGKGRPLKFYALRATIDEIINYYEAEKNREYAKAMESIQRLRELTTV